MRLAKFKTRPKLNKIFDFPVLHLSGGMTAHFLACIKNRKAIECFQKFSKKGGLFVAISAGAIVLGPDIRIATLCGDKVENDTLGLNLVPFYFLPHYTHSISSQIQAQQFANKFNGNVFAAENGAGLLVNGSNIINFGAVHEFKNDTLS